MELPFIVAFEPPRPADPRVVPVVGLERER